VAIDPFGTTLANKAMDLSDCKTLKHVLALYPSEPLPAIAAHVPLFPTYPKDTLVTESAIAGCHANAQRLTRARNGQNYKMDANTFIPFARMVDFFETHGTTFKKFSPTTYVDDWDVEWDVDRDIDSKEDRKKFLLDIYKSKANNEDISKASRSCHSSPGTVLIKTKSEITDYFNAHHQELANVPRDNATCRVAIEHKHNRVPSLIKEYPKTWQFLKWTAVSVGITASLFLTGGLSALVGLIGVSLASAVGTAIGLTATALTVGGVLSGLWYGVLKPLVHQMAYPSFKVHQTPEVLPENNEIIGSSYENLNVLLKVDKQIIRQLSDSNERSLSTSENDKKIDEVDDILIEDLNDNVSMSF